MKRNITRISIAGLLAAVIFLSTYFLQIPVFTGNINLGDSVILFAVYLIGSDAIFAAAVGSMLADLLSGYAIYAPATFCIKALMVLAALPLLRSGKKIRRIFAFCIAEAVMVLGYFLYDSLIFGLAGAIKNAGTNAVQGILAVIIGMLLSMMIKPRKSRMEQRK